MPAANSSSRWSRRGAVLALLLGGALALAACGGVPVEDAPATLEPEDRERIEDVSGTPQPADPLSEPPADFSEWPGVLLRYLNDNDVRGCPDDVLAAWNQTTPAPRCLEVDLNGDTRDDLVLLLSKTAFQAGEEQSGAIVAMVASAEGYILGYESPADAGVSSPYVLVARDIDGDGRSDFSFVTSDCGANICTTRLHVVGFRQQRMQELPGDVSGNNLQAVVIGDHLPASPGLEIRLEGNVVESVAAGPQRETTRVFAFVDGVLQEISRTVADSDYLYFRIRDADRLLDSGQHEAALEAYTAAIQDAGLRDWRQENGLGSDRTELIPYAYFRRALAEALLGRDTVLGTMAEAHQRQGVFGVAAGAFGGEWELSGDISKACANALNWLSAESVSAALDYGYTNPAPTPKETCPY